MNFLLFRFAAIATISLFFYSICHAEGRDVRILVDGSALTGQLDKVELRKVVLDTLVGGLLDEGDQVGVWRVDDRVVPLLEYGKLTAAHRRAFSKTLEKVTWSGLQRNLRIGFSEVDFAGEGNESPELILITGGVSKTGRSIQEALLNNYVVDNTSVTLSQRNIALHVLEIGNDGEPFFRKLVRRSGQGEYFTLRAERDKLYAALNYLSGLFGKSVEISTTNSFAIFDDATNVTVVVRGANPSDVKLIHPEGRPLNAKNSTRGVHWTRFSSDTLIHIGASALRNLPKPESLWSIQQPQGEGLVIGSPIAFLVDLNKGSSEDLLVAEKENTAKQNRQRLFDTEDEDFGFSELDFGEDTSGRFKGELGVDVGLFPSKGINDQNKLHGSVFVRPELDFSINEGKDIFDYTFFARWDTEDEERTHVDVRELLWTHVGNRWETKFGIGKVFWGVTESQHLVDIVNQTDLVEGQDEESKLGQPMAKFGLETGFGNIDLYWLWYFRERTFPGPEGRFTSAIPMDRNDPVYSDDSEQWHQDFAVRYSHYIESFDFALSWFSGTSREPLAVLNGQLEDPRLTLLYPTIDQAGLELQYSVGAMLLKFEGIHRIGFGKAYSAVTAGFEYTQYGIFGSAWDLGWLGEYLWDERGDQATTLFEHDWFAALRFTANDEASTEILVGTIVDPESSEIAYQLEASRRLGETMRVEVQGVLFTGSKSLPEYMPDRLQQIMEDPVANKAAALRDEDYIRLQWSYFF